MVTIKQITDFYSLSPLEIKIFIFLCKSFMVGDHADYKMKLTQGNLRYKLPLSNQVVIERGSLGMYVEETSRVLSAFIIYKAMLDHEGKMRVAVPDNHVINFLLNSYNDMTHQLMVSHGIQVSISVVRELDPRASLFIVRDADIEGFDRKLIAIPKTIREPMKKYAGLLTGRR